MAIQVWSATQGYEPVRDARGDGKGVDLAALGGEEAKERIAGFGKHRWRSGKIVD